MIPDGQLQGIYKATAAQGDAPKASEDMRMNALRIIPGHGSTECNRTIAGDGSNSSMLRSALREAVALVKSSDRGTSVEGRRFIFERQPNPCSANKISEAK